VPRPVVAPRMLGAEGAVHPTTGAPFAAHAHRSFERVAGDQACPRSRALID
jgi:hypothetical protein